MSTGEDDQSDSKAGEELQKDAPAIMFTAEEVADLLTEAEASSVQLNGPSTEVRYGDGFFIPGRPAAVAMSFVAVACLTALVLVTNASGANALATIALSLAVLAFMIQIIVFIYQSVASNQQLLQSEQVFTETRALLTEVNTAAKSTEDLVRDQFQDVLKAFLDVQPGGKQEANFLSALRTELAASRSSVSPSQPRATGALERAQRRVAAKTRRTKSSFFEFPEESEGAAAVDALKALPLAALARIRDLAEDQRLLTGLSRLDQLGEPVQPIDKPLEEAGLTRTARISNEGDTLTVSQLTDEGLAGANVLLATGEVPAYAREFLEQPHKDED